MFLKHLINPKPTIIISFIVFSIIHHSIPLLKCSFNECFGHEWLPTYFVYIFGLVVIFFHSLGLNNLIYEKSIIKKDNLVVGVTYFIMCSPFLNNINSFLISFFLLFYIFYLFDSYQKEYPLSQYFNASIIISILSFLNLNITFLIFLIIIAGINYSNLKFRGIIVVVIGLLIPYIIYFYLSLITEIPFNTPSLPKIQFIELPSFINLHIFKLFYLTTILLISILGFFELYRWLYKKSIKSRKSFIIIFLYFILCSTLLFDNNYENLYYLITPLSIIVSNYFIYTKNRFLANLLFFLLLCSSMLYRFVINL